MSSAKQRGDCPVCERQTTFAADHGNHRESPVCLTCGSVPRQRALVKLVTSLVAIPTARVHESSPSLSTYRFFKPRCRHFIASYYFTDISPGGSVGQFQCVDLHDQPFASGSLDIVVTLDVMEHVTEPMRALAEIQRTLTTNGMHVFTVPRAPHAATKTRAIMRKGRLELLESAEYHRDPVSKTGALVVTDWGNDLESLLAAAGIRCEAHVIQEARIGVPKPVEAFVARAEP